MGENNHEIEKIIEEGIIRFKKKELIEELKDLDQTLDARIIRKRLIVSLGIAASVILVIGFMMLLYGGKVTWEEQLVEEYITEYRILGTDRRGGDDTVPSYLLTKAQDHYREREWKKAAKSFKRILKYDETSFHRLYLGICQLRLRQSNKAVQSLKEFNNTNTIVDLEDPGQWYLALAYLQKGELENAQELFLKFENHVDYGSLSRQLLQAIEEYQAF